MKNKKLYAAVKDGAIILLSAILAAIGSHVFIYGNNFAPGGVAGIVNMINHFLPINITGPLVLAINIPLIILSFIYLNKPFAIKTTANIALVSALVSLLSYLNVPQFISQSSIEHLGDTITYIDYGKSLIAAGAGGVFMGVSLALMFLVGGSTGGTDIPAAIIQKKNEFISVSWMIFLVNAIVIAISSVVYCFDPQTSSFTFSIEQALMPILLAMIYIVCSSIMSDLILSGGKTAVKFEVITPDPDKLGKELLQELRHGVTLLHAEGMYSQSSYGMLICIVSKREITHFKHVLAKHPDTFSYRSGVSEVIGKFRKYKKSGLDDAE